MTEKYDLHTHLFTTWEKGKYSLERAPRNPDYILDAVKNAGLDGIALVNFEDIRFEDFAAQSRVHAGRYRLVRELSNALTFTDGIKALRVLRGQEIPTLEGHVLALAGNTFSRIPKGLSLQETLRQVNNLGLACVADHYSGYMGIGKEKLLESAESFHAYERANANCKRVSEEEVENMLKVTGLYGIDVSDSHNRKDLGNGYIEVNNSLDFSSEDNLKESLKNMLKSGRFKPVFIKRNSLLSRAGHIAICMYDSKIRRLCNLV